MINTLKIVAVYVVFGSAVLIALPVAAIYGTAAYISAALKASNKLTKKLRKYGHIS